MAILAFFLVLLSRLLDDLDHLLDRRHHTGSHNDTLPSVSVRNRATSSAVSQWSAGVTYLSTQFRRDGLTAFERNTVAPVELEPEGKVCQTGAEKI